MPVVKGFEHLGDLRLPDLIAKTGKVTLRDTIRVLIAAQAVCRQFGLSLSDIVSSDFEFSTDRPSSANVAACEQAYRELEVDNKKALDAVASFK